MLALLKTFLLIRPHNIAAAVLSVAAGFAVAGGAGPWPVCLLLSTALVTAAGNVINDWFDRDIDTINKPRRPIPSGGVTPRAALLLYCLLLAAIAACMTRLPAPQAIWVAVWAVLLHIYSWKAKRIWLAGNILVASVVSSAFLLGAFAAGDTVAGTVPAAFTFFFVLGRELVKDTEDIAGDRECGARTVPVVSGSSRTLTAAAVIFIVLSAVIPLPYIFGVFGRGYLFTMLLSVLPVLVVSCVFCLRRGSPAVVSLLLKLGMFFGVAAFYLG
ncbi:MAG: geranylgeranylglycerol-phosphate geranylgeranyltransferase [Candidatus Krumholzibacteria bacterium]|nr:geranylgeranylglycerol-phosphate geranylgeranyltransferase [Candidatus Krumholzibacteria bacterium]